MTWTKACTQQLLHTSKDNALYDEYNDVRKDALIALGFYPKYLTYKAAAQRSHLSTPNWVSARTVFRENTQLRIPMWRVLTWTWRPGLPNLRPNVTHARGVFVDRVNKLVITYEPRKITSKKTVTTNDIEKGTLKMFNAAHTEFCQQFGPVYQFVTVFGFQVYAWDCEKRVLQFGICCLDSVIEFVRSGRRGAVDIKCHSKGCWLSVSAVLPFSVRS